MKDVSVQTDDILINGIPLNEFIKNNSNIVENNNSVWDFMNENNSETDEDNGDDDEHHNGNIQCDIVDICPPLSDVDIQEMRESIFHCIEQNVIHNPLSFSDPTFHAKLENSVYEIIDETFSYGSYGLLIRNDVFTFTDDMENSL